MQSLGLQVKLPCLSAWLRDRGIDIVPESKRYQMLGTGLGIIAHGMQMWTIITMLTTMAINFFLIRDMHAPENADDYPSDTLKSTYLWWSPLILFHLACACLLFCSYMLSWGWLHARLGLDKNDN